MKVISFRNVLFSKANDLKLLKLETNAEFVGFGLLFRISNRQEMLKGIIRTLKHNKYDLKFSQEANTIACMRKQDVIKTPRAKKIHYPCLLP